MKSFHITGTVMSMNHIFFRILYIKYLTLENHYFDQNLNLV